MTDKKITISARRNGDYTYRGMVWAKDQRSPLLIVGLDDEEYYTPQEARDAARAAAILEGLIAKNKRVRTLNE